MAYPVWPASLPDPEIPLSGEFRLPIATGNTKALGGFQSERERTRPTQRGSVSVLLTAAQLTAFRTFWATTLSRGTARFTADWLAAIYDDGYVARIVTYSTAFNGSLPTLKLSLEVLPDVRVVAAVPSPWPAP